MSLSSLLLAKAGGVDNELDALFKSTPKPLDASTSKPKSTDTSDKKQKKKRKADESASVSAGPSTAKKLKTRTTEDAPESSTSKSKSKTNKSKEPKDKKESKEKKELKEKKESKASSKQEPKAVVPPSPLAKSKSKPSPKKSKSKKADTADEESEDEDDNSDIENRYLARTTKAGTSKEDEAPQEDEDMNVDGDDESEDEAVDPSTLVHESLQPSKSKSRAAKQKFVPSEETAERRDQRTVFVGNIPIAVASKRPLQKQLQKHMISLVPGAKIESVRFRSVPFQNPTSKLPTSDDEGDAPAKPKSVPPHLASNHASVRSLTWRTKLDEKDESVVKQDEKKYLTPGQKKKIAFIHGEFHGEADSVNAYVVFAHPLPEGTRPANLPPLPMTIDPYDAAKLAVEKCNNTIFMERVIRVDRVGVKGKAAVPASDDKEAEGAGSLLDADPKFTIFVGNLDFASKEEDLRVFFENLVVSEKGPAPTTGDEEEEDGVKKPASWVVRVRIIRDKETQLGKGFAYVQFSDKECVDEILALEELKLKFAKRKLRVQRCKTLPGSSVKVKPTPKGKVGKDGKPVKPRSAPVVVPKGDPTLGERLAHLPKVVRKQAKAADGDRIARRLAKKKARMAMGPPKGDVDSRDRSRKSGAAKKDGVNTGKKTAKPRVRNAKNAAARNAKK